MTTPPVRPSVRPAPGAEPFMADMDWKEQRLVSVRNSAAEALGIIADQFPALGRRRLGIRWGEAYRIAMLELKEAGLILPRDGRGEGYRWNRETATPSAVRDVWRRFSYETQKVEVSVTP